MVTLCPWAVLGAGRLHQGKGPRREYGGAGGSGAGALLPLDSIGHVEQIVQPVEAEGGLVASGAPRL